MQREPRQTFSDSLLLPSARREKQKDSEGGTKNPPTGLIDIGRDTRDAALRLRRRSSERLERTSRTASASEEPRVQPGAQRGQVLVARPG